MVSSRVGRTFTGNSATVQLLREPRLQRGEPRRASTECHASISCLASLSSLANWLTEGLEAAMTFLHQIQENCGKDLADSGNARQSVEGLKRVTAEVLGVTTVGLH